MNVELQINNSPAQEARFVSWAPSPCRIRVTNPAGATGPTVNVKISGASAATAGALVLRKGTTGTFAASITVAVPTNGSSVPFFVAGKFGRPSSSNGDVTLEARFGTTLVGSTSLMVRIRKNATKLTPTERDRFVSAFAQLNNQGLGRFADFRDMHRTTQSLNQAHTLRHFCRGTGSIFWIWSASFRRSIQVWHYLIGASIRPRPASSLRTSSDLRFARHGSV